MFTLSPPCCPQSYLFIESAEDSSSPKHLTCPNCHKTLGTLSLASGYIYVLSSEAFPNYYKIGFTLRNVAERINELNGSTSLPSPFRAELIFHSIMPKKDEGLIHKTMAKFRLNDNREFFKVSLLEAFDQIKIILGRDPSYCSQNAAHLLALREVQNKPIIKVYNTEKSRLQTVTEQGQSTSSKKNRFGLLP